MTKNIIGFALGAMLFALSFSAGAYGAERVYRIGYISTGPAFRDLDATFRQRLRELGMVVGVERFHHLVGDVQARLPRHRFLHLVRQRIAQGRQRPSLGERQAAVVVLNQ